MLATFLAALLLGDQVPAPAPTQPTPTPTQEISNYVVGPEDVLTVTVVTLAVEPNFSGRFRVENDGHFEYPYLGRIKAGGSTLAEITALLKAKLVPDYLVNPQVRIEVETFRSQSVFVMGAVRSPAKYTLTGNVTLMEALALAGSTTADAGSEVWILTPKVAARGSAARPEDGDADIQRVNLRDLETGKLSQNVTIRDGDTIIVPKAEKFYVTGLVRNVGSYVWEPNMTVLRAISMAGGVSDRGSNRRIRITRVVNNKQVTVDAKETDLVQPGDTILVRQRIL